MTQLCDRLLGMIGRNNIIWDRLLGMTGGNEITMGETLWHDTVL